jgi:predicted TIM-barrel fold metal-dependent hydrolase
MLIIDTHAHIYSPDEKRYPTIEKPLRPPPGKGALEDLRQESRANGVEAVCAIQTSTFYRFDNRYILDSSKANPDWVAGVCTLNPDNPNSPSLLAKYVREYGIRGMRSIPAKSGELDHPGVRALWQTALDEGIVINVLVGPHLSDHVDRMLNQFPDLRVVLDHCFSPKVGPELEPTIRKAIDLARHRNLHAKLTFVPTASATGFPCADLHEACRKVADAFGPERCVWGSDYPSGLWTPKVTYAKHLKIFTEVLPFGDEARRHILGETAKRLWFPML